MKLFGWEITFGARSPTAVPEFRPQTIVWLVGRLGHDVSASDVLDALGVGVSASDPPSTWEQTVHGAVVAKTAECAPRRMSRGGACRVYTGAGSEVLSVQGGPLDEQWRNRSLTFLGPAGERLELHLRHRAARTDADLVAGDGHADIVWRQERESFLRRVQASWWWSWRTVDYASRWAVQAGGVRVATLRRLGDPLGYEWTGDLVNSSGQRWANMHCYSIRSSHVAIIDSHECPDSGARLLAIASGLVLVNHDCWMDKHRDQPGGG